MKIDYRTYSALVKSIEDYLRYNESTLDGLAEVVSLSEKEFLSRKDSPVPEIIVYGKEDMCLLHVDVEDIIEKSLVVGFNQAIHEGLKQELLDFNGRKFYELEVRPYIEKRGLKFNGHNLAESWGLVANDTVHYNKVARGLKRMGDRTGE